MITRCEPPRALAYTWGGSPGQPSEVLFELKAQDKGTLLTLTHRKLADRAAMVDVAAGWHAHLRVLSARLEGHQPGRSGPPWKRCRKTTKPTFRAPDAGASPARRPVSRRRAWRPRRIRWRTRAPRPNASFNYYYRGYQPDKTG